MPARLPIEPLLPRLGDALAGTGRVLLSAPTGSGKTTVVPLALLDEPWLQGRSIIVLEPRRLAARLAARFMAGKLGQRVGETVGYRVRFESRVSERTRIEVVTGGVLLRRLQNDPELAGTGLVILDEFHERSLEGDLILALCLDIQEGLREDLRLLVMSATLAVERLRHILGQAPLLEGAGHLFPVTRSYLPPRREQDSARPDHIAATTCRGIRQALAECRGDILAFLPGRQEIRLARQRLAPLAERDPGLLVQPLHGSMRLADQDRAVLPDPDGRRRILLATTIAETSLTIEGIDAVVDCGWKRAPRFDPATGLTRLETVRISRASAEQRCGRAGRLGPGTCYRLWHRGADQALQPFDTPEILQADLAPLVLELALWGVADPGLLAWPDPPPSGAVRAARELLLRLGAVDARGRITGEGRKMASLPVHPRLAAMLVRAGRNGIGLACDLAALLGEPDLLGQEADSVDLEDRLHLLRRFRQGDRVPFPRRCLRVDRISRQLRRLAGAGSGDAPGPGSSAAGLLSLAYPERIAGQRPGRPGSYKLVSGRGAALPRHDRLRSSSFLAIAALDSRRAEGMIHLAAALSWQELRDLHGHGFVRQREVFLDPETGTVRAADLVLLGELELERVACPQPPPEKVTAILLAEIRRRNLECLPWGREATSLVRRVRLLAAGEEGWPDFSRQGLLESLEQWLGPYLADIRSLGELKRLDLAGILRSRLDWQHQKHLDRMAPTHIRVPSGSRIRLDYRDQGPPVLAVRIQELFGLAETPAICNGRVRLLLHLLSPARRPVQVTDDLAGFWRNSYHQVRKELRGRYPKHHWPDDPLAAAATSRAKPRPGKGSR